MIKLYNNIKVDIRVIYFCSTKDIINCHHVYFSRIRRRNTFVVINLRKCHSQICDYSEIVIMTIK